MLLPACTGFGEATFVTDRLGPVVPTMVETVAVLFASVASSTEELTVADPEMTVPFATPVFTFTAIVKLDELSPAKFALVQTTFPVLLTFGVMQAQPAGMVTD